MKIAVFGATGGTGREVVRLALAGGHSVRALVRAPAERAPDGVEGVVGDVRDPAAVEATVRGVQAVIVALGAPASDRSGLREAGTRRVVQAMQAQAVRRLVVLSVLGAHESRAGLDWFTRQVLFRFWLQHAVADHEAQESVVRSSGLDWTLARPPHLSARGATGGWTAGFDLTARPPAMSIARADLAAFLLDCAVSERYVGEAPGVVR